jgi:predicted small metal-binding protein
MPKIFRCNDLDVQCNWGSTAETEEELLKLVIEHAGTEHNACEINEAMRNKILDAMRDQE